MSIPVPPIAVLPPYVPPYAPVPNITPFTYRDGATYLQILEGLRHYINVTIVPFVNENYGELADTFTTEVDRLIQAVNDAINLVLNDSVDLQDPVMEAIIKDVDSLSRLALDDIYANQSEADALDIRVSNLESGGQSGINVKEYGVIGDGIVDDTNAIQTILDANPGGRLFFPNGVYKYSSLVMKNQTLVGAGQFCWRDRMTVFGDPQYLNNANFKGTLLRSTLTANAASITIVDTEVASGGINDMSIVGPGVGGATGIFVGNQTWTMVNLQIKRVLVANFAQGVATNYMNEADVQSLMIRGCTVGFNMMFKTNQNVFTMLDIQFCRDGLIIVDQCYANQFNGLLLQQITGQPVRCGGIKNAFYNPYFEQYGTAYAFLFTSTALGNKVDTPFFSANEKAVDIMSGAVSNNFTNVGGYGSTNEYRNAGTYTYIQGRMNNFVENYPQGRTVIVDPNGPGSIYGPPIEKKTSDGSAPIIGGIIPGNIQFYMATRENGGKVEGEVTLTIGSSTVMNGILTFQTPHAPSNAAGGRPLAVLLFNGGDNWYGAGSGYVDAAGIVHVGQKGANDEVAPFTSSTPFVWNENDVIAVNFAFETNE